MMRLPYEKERCSWPEEAKSQIQSGYYQNSISKAILHQRAGNSYLAETIFLACLQRANDTDKIIIFDLLAGLHLRKGDLETAQLLLTQAETLCENDQAFSIKNSLNLRRHQIDPVANKQEKDSISASESELLWLQTVKTHLLTNNDGWLQQTLANWPAEACSPEALELKGIAYRKLGHLNEAMNAFNTLLMQGCGSVNVWTYVVELNFHCGRNNGLAITTASRKYPRSAKIAHLRNAIQVMSREAAAGRRSAFQERILYGQGQHKIDPDVSDGNLINAYDQTGCVHLTPYLHRNSWNLLQKRSTSGPNIVMQLASLTHPKAIEACQQLASTYPQPQPFKRSHSNQRLRVALLSPDLHYHPVGRFVQMLLEAGLATRGELFVVSTDGQTMKRTKELSGEGFIDLSKRSETERLAILRDLNLDVAVDLTGWTANNNAILFAQRIAHVQINYLGYFASSGLPAMDVWLGDSGLFPEPMNEWHSETIERLPRPFLAWNPSQYLAEGNVGITRGPEGAITFGCFNHVRKLSKSTLTLWAELLNSIPNSKLALKAFTSDDPGVTQLLKQRMHRCGLDSEKIIWLPTAPKPEDHLRQYGLIDIGLDPFPNGGCTTTCEALWMGVPVITLEGDHYVSRMSSAVLKAAELDEWIATSQKHYIDIAIHQATRVNELRNNRQLLREHLQKSPLGNTQELAQCLWDCWERLSQSRSV